MLSLLSVGASGSAGFTKTPNGKTKFGVDGDINAGLFGLGALFNITY